MITATVVFWTAIVLAFVFLLGVLGCAVAALVGSLMIAFGRTH